MSTATEQMLTPSQLEAIPHLSFSNVSYVNAGSYSVPHHEKRGVIAHDDNGAVSHDIWFQTQPLNSDLIQRIHSMQLFAESHDGANVDDEKFGNWTWFEIAVLRNNEPKAKDGIKLAWVSHENRIKTTEYGWERGEKFTEDHDLFRLLEEGDTIAVRLCARFQDWAIKARTGFLVFEIGKPITRDPLWFGQTKKAVLSIQEVFNEVNSQMLPDGTLLPTPPKEMLFRAEMFTSASDRPLRVLSLDGGGIRGIASLKHLKAIMKEAAPGKKPYEVFDMIGGTSTGGLIAIMLGRLQMDVQECIDSYEEFMYKVFPRSHPEYLEWALGVGSVLWKGSKWDATPLENSIKKLVREKLPGQDPEKVLLLDDANTAKTCKVFVTATPQEDANNSPPVLFRSYTNGLERPEMPNIKLWEAARATSAAPLYFEPLKVGDKTFLDGGLQANNPLGWLWNEILSVFGPARPTSWFLSIGTGLPGSVPLPKVNTPSLGFVKGLSSIATNSEITNVLFRTLINAFAPKPMGKKYWRFNVGDGLPDWVEENGYYVWKNLGERKPGDGGAMDDINALKQIKRLADEYIDQPGFQKMIAECADALKNEPK